MAVEPVVDADPHQLLFSAERIDAAWVAAFKRGLAVRADWLAACEAVVSQRYAADVAARDGYSRIALGLARKGKASDATSWFERDWALDRMMRWQFLRYIEALLVLDREAEAQERIEDYYCRHPEAHDAWTALAWHLTKRGDHARAARLATRDRDAARLSVDGLLRQGEIAARGGRWSEADGFVSQAYAKNDRLRDGFGRLARLCATQRNWPRALDYFSRDRASGRQTPATVLVYAETLAHAGEATSASTLVGETYARDSHVLDGFGHIAHALLTYGRRVESHAFLLRDRQVGRQSPAYTLRLVAMTALASPESKIDELRSWIEEAYARSPGLKDGFVGLAQAFETFGETGVVRDLFERDFALGRMSRQAFRKYVEFVASIEKAADVVPLIESAYARDRTLQDGFAMLGRAQLRSNDIAAALDGFERDRRAQRLSPVGLFDYAMARHETGDFETAFALAEEIPAQHWARASFARDAHQPGMVKSALGKLAPPLVASLLASCDERDEIMAIVEQALRRDAGLQDVFSCGARALLKAGDIDGAKSLFERDWRAGRAASDSLMQFALLLEPEDPRRVAILAAAWPAAHFPEDSWLANMRDSKRGQTCYILGTGPSIRTLDVSALSGRAVFVTNGAYLLPGLQFQYFVSVAEGFWRHHVAEINQLECERLFLPHWLRGALSPRSPVTWMNAPMPRTVDAAHQRMPVPVGFSPVPALFVALGGTVVSVCLQLAFHLGFRRAVLLGVDHNYRDAGMTIAGAGGRKFSAEQTQQIHFTDRYYRGGVYHCDIPAMERAYVLCRDAFASAGRSVVNATPGSRLDVFPRVDLDAMLADGG